MQLETPIVNLNTVQKLSRKALLFYKNTTEELISLPLCEPYVKESQLNSNATLVNNF